MLFVSVQTLHLDLVAGSGDHRRCRVLNLHARGAPYILYYLSGPRKVEVLTSIFCVFLPTKPIKESRKKFFIQTNTIKHDVVRKSTFFYQTQGSQWIWRISPSFWGGEDRRKSETVCPPLWETLI